VTHSDCSGNTALAVTVTLVSGTVSWRSRGDPSPVLTQDAVVGKWRQQRGCPQAGNQGSWLLPLAEGQQVSCPLSLGLPGLSPASWMCSPLREGKFITVPPAGQGGHAPGLETFQASQGWTSASVSPSLRPGPEPLCLFSCLQRPACLSSLAGGGMASHLLSPGRSSSVPSLSFFPNNKPDHTQSRPA
jgi:hypothetical protein